MTDTPARLEPGPNHPITIDRSWAHVTVKSGSVVIAETDRALELHEANYPSVFYIPTEDVDHQQLRGNDEHSYCPYKGEASYYDLLAGEGGPAASAVWYYPDPYSAVEAIGGHVAFYADRVTITVES